MKFIIDGAALTIRFEGMEQLWAAKRKLVLPKTDIARAVWQEAVSIPRSELGVRVGGANLPGILYAGRFAGRDGLNFVYLNRPAHESHMVKLRHVLTLELQNVRYHRMIFTVDKPEIAEQIIAWWSANV